MDKHEIRIVLASHGAQAQGMLETVQMLLGAQENMAAYCLSPEQTRDDLTELLKKEVETYGAENILFMTDLLYGSPFNAVTELTRNHTIYHISGMNTICLMTAVMERGNEGATPESICEAVMETSQNSIVDARLLLAANQADEEEEEL